MLESLTHYHPVTGLPNEALLLTRIHDSMKKAKPEKALFYIGIGRLHFYNRAQDVD